MNNTENKRVKTLIEDFKKEFKGEFIEAVAKSCGRLEILGNHLDYENGIVINSSIDNLSILAVASRTLDKKIVIKSKGYSKLVINTENVDYNKSYDTDTSYGLVRGIVRYFKDHNWNVGGMHLVMESTIPSGGGVSSSAAYSMVICKLLSYFYNDNSLSVVELAKCAKWSENNYFGKNSGLQDQLGSASVGMEVIDFKDPENPIIKHFHNNLPGYKIVLLKTSSSHAGASDAFNDITYDYQYVAKKMNAKHLREIAKEDFELEFNKEENKNDEKFIRTSHYFNEMERVKESSLALENDDLKVFVKNIRESGYSNENILKNVLLKNETESEYQRVLHKARGLIKDGAVRVHGGGFGGAVFVILNENEEAEFIKEMKKDIGNDNVIEIEVSYEPFKIMNPASYIN